MQGLVVASSSPPAGGQGNVIGLKRQPDLEVGDGLSVDTAIVQLKRFVAGFRKRWKFVLAIVAASLLVGILLTLRAAPVYQATGSLKIEGVSTDVLNVQGADPNAYVDEVRSVNTEIELIESRSFAEFVVKKLNLASDNDFFEKMKIDTADFGGSAQQVRAQREAAAANVLRGGVSARAKKETRILFVDFEAPDAAIAAKVTNAYLEGAIATDEQRAFGTTKFARDFLENRLDQAKAKLEASERDAIAYARNANLVDTSSARSKEDDPIAPSLGISNLIDLNKAYSEARANRIGLEAQWRQASSISAAAQPEVFENQALQGLMASRAEIAAQYDSLSETQRPTHPEMKRLKAKLETIGRNINQNLANFKNSLRSRFEIAKRQEEALGVEVARLTSASLDEQDRNVQLGILKREIDTNRTFYDALLQRYKEVSAAAGSYTNAISIVDMARAPGAPIRPRPLLNMAIALALGVMISLLFVFLLEQFDDSVRSPAQLTEKLGLALIGVVPRHGNELDLNQDILDKKAQVAESYMSVRTTLNFTSPSGSPSPLLIASTKPSEGKSSTAISTALSFARSGSRVLLIDGDLRKPSLHRTLQLKNDQGFSELLSNQKLMNEVIKTAFDDRLYIITSGTIPPDPVSLLSGLRLKQVLQEAQKAFDMIIIDGPPVMGLADAPLIAAASKAVLFVVESGGRTNQQKIALSRMAVTGTPIVGAVLTKFDSKAEGFGNEYSYAYDAKYLHQVGYG